MDYQEELRSFKPLHEFFIGIDSDGCVFDSMEVKQKEFFIPNALKYFDLFPISKFVRETWEFVNLYSLHRGINRFPAMIKVFDLLAERKEVFESDCRLPDLSALKEWIRQETKLSNSSLRRYNESAGDPELERVIAWSEAVNHEISRWLKRIPPFPGVVNAIEKISGLADLIIVSQTPLEALDREWKESGLKKSINIIAAQEHGTKSEHISLSAGRKYPDNKILMIGDAMGDLEAAAANGILFYPVLPGREELSWRRFIDEGLKKFVEGSFRGIYEDNLISEFRRSLPCSPPWIAKT